MTNRTRTHSAPSTSHAVGHRVAVATLAALVTAFTVVACGGGGGGGGAPATVKLSGIVAHGAPDAGVTVTVKDANGNTTTATTGSDGSYSADVTSLTAPFRIEAPNALAPSDPTQNIYSVAYGGGTTNVTPLTNLAFNASCVAVGSTAAAAFTAATAPLPTQGTLGQYGQTVRNIIAPALVSNNVDPSTFDPFKTAFVADSTGVDKVLDNTTFGTDGSGNTTVRVQDGNGKYDATTTVTPDTANSSATFDTTVTTNTTGASNPASSQTVTAPPTANLLSGTYAFVGFSFGGNTTQPNTPSAGTPMPSNWPLGFHSEAGSVTFGSDGSVTGTSTNNTEGTGSTNTFSATYYLNNNNTFSISDSSGGSLKGAMLPDGNVAVLTQSPPDSPNIIVAVKKGSGFNAASLNGTWSFVGYRHDQSGTPANTPAQGQPLPPPVGFTTESGTVTFSDGSLSGTSTDDTDGTLGSANPFTGTYTMASDGSFSITTPGGPGPTGVLGANGSIAVLSQPPGTTNSTPEVIIAIKTNGQSGVVNNDIAASYAFEGYRFDRGYFSSVSQATPAAGTPLPIPAGFDAESGVVTFDNAGGLSGTSQQNRDGFAQAAQSFTATYVLASDGSFTISDASGPGPAGVLLKGAGLVIMTQQAGQDPEILIALKR